MLQQNFNENFCSYEFLYTADLSYFRYYLISIISNRWVELGACSFVVWGFRSMMNLAHFRHEFQVVTFTCRLVVSSTFEYPIVRSENWKNFTIFLTFIFITNWCIISVLNKNARVEITIMEKKIVTYMAQIWLSDAYVQLNIFGSRINQASLSVVSCVEVTWIKFASIKRVIQTLSSYSTSVLAVVFIFEWVRTINYCRLFWVTISGSKSPAFLFVLICWAHSYKYNKKDAELA